MKTSASVRRAINESVDIKDIKGFNQIFLRCFFFKGKKRVIDKILVRVKSRHVFLMYLISTFVDDAKIGEDVGAHFE